MENYLEFRDKDNVEHDAKDRIYWNQKEDGDASNHTAVFEVTPEA